MIFKDRCQSPPTKGRRLFQVALTCLVCLPAVKVISEGSAFALDLLHSKVKRFRLVYTAASRSKLVEKCRTRTGSSYRSYRLGCHWCSSQLSYPGVLCQGKDSNLHHPTKFSKQPERVFCLSTYLSTCWTTLLVYTSLAWLTVQSIGI